MQGGYTASKPTKKAAPPEVQAEVNTKSKGMLVKCKANSRKMKKNIFDD